MARSHDAVHLLLQKGTHFTAGPAGSMHRVLGVGLLGQPHLQLTALPLVLVKADLQAYANH